MPALHSTTATQARIPACKIWQMWDLPTRRYASGLAGLSPSATEVSVLKLSSDGCPAHASALQTCPCHQCAWHPCTVWVSVTVISMTNSRNHPERRLLTPEPLQIATLRVFRLRTLEEGCNFSHWRGNGYDSRFGCERSWAQFRDQPFALRNAHRALRHHPGWLRAFFFHRV